MLGRVVRVAAIAYGIIGALTIVLMLFGLQGDALGAAPAILVGMPLTMLLGRLPSSTSPFLGIALVTLAIAANFIILTLVARLIRKRAD